MKKKVIAIIVLIALILIASKIFAVANLKAKTSCSTNELKGGQEVSIVLRFDEYQGIKTGINAYKATLDYNKEIFEEVTQDNFVTQNNWEELKYNKATNEFIAIKKVGSNTPEDIVKITLKAKEGAKRTSTDIIIKDIVTSEGEKDISVVEAKETIQIIEEQTEEPDKIEKITSQKYKIESLYISRILPNTTVAQFKENIVLENVTTNPQMIFTDTNGNALNEDSLISTGINLKIGNTLNY